MFGTFPSLIHTNEINVRGLKPLRHTHPPRTPRLLPTQRVMRWCDAGIRKCGKRFAHRDAIRDPVVTQIPSS